MQQVVQIKNGITIHDKVIVKSIAHAKKFTVGILGIVVVRIVSI